MRFSWRTNSSRCSSNSETRRPAAAARERAAGGPPAVLMDGPVCGVAPRTARRAVIRCGPVINVGLSWTETRGPLFRVYILYSALCELKYKLQQ